MGLTIVGFDREGLATDDPSKTWVLEWINEAGNTVHAEETKCADGETWESYARRLERRIKEQRDQLLSLQEIHAACPRQSYARFKRGFSHSP